MALLVAQVIQVLALIKSVDCSNKDNYQMLLQVKNSFLGSHKGFDLKKGSYLMTLCFEKVDSQDFNYFELGEIQLELDQVEVMEQVEVEEQEQEA